MLFNSFDYLVFLPVIFILFHFVIPVKIRWPFLLAASYYFYMCWRVEYIFLIALSTIVDYWAGIKMSEKKEKKDRKKYLYASLIINLGMLFFFKYYDFFIYNSELAFSKFNIFYDSYYFKFLLPVGISFYTFQTLSYTIDVYRGKATAEKHLGYFALYVSYFPQLVAGPIERPNDLIPQIRETKSLTAEDVRYAINKILLGFFKKVVVADTIAIYCDQMFTNPGNGTGAQYYVTSLLFNVQLFCDFSGYSDIAIGTARLFGVRLRENFNGPFWATSFSDFWNRWHMSLTTWIGDYIFAPMVRNFTKWSDYIGIGVFVLIGFWHGASWNFIVFGFIHGLIMYVQRRYKKIPRIKKFNKTKFAYYFYLVWTFHLLSFTGLFFRNSLSNALKILGHIFTDFRIGFDELKSAYQTEMMMGIFVSILVFFTAFFNKELRFRHNTAYIMIMLLIIILFGQNFQNQFIYFQF